MRSHSRLAPTRLRKDATWTKYNFASMGLVASATEGRGAGVSRRGTVGSVCPTGFASLGFAEAPVPAFVLSRFGSPAGVPAAANLPDFASLHPGAVDMSAQAAATLLPESLPSLTDMDASSERISGVSWLSGRGSFVSPAMARKLRSAILVSPPRTPSTRPGSTTP